MNTSINDLQSKGYSAMEYPEGLRRAVAAAVESWKGFCTLPLEAKKSVSGYESKDGIGYKMDRKEKIDVSYPVASALASSLESVENHIVRDFLRGAISIFAMLKPMLTNFARQSQAAYDLKGFADEVEDSAHRSLLRFINYPGKSYRWRRDCMGSC